MWGSNPQPPDQESHPPAAEPAGCPCSSGVLIKCTLLCNQSPKIFSSCQTETLWPSPSSPPLPPYHLHQHHHIITITVTIINSINIIIISSSPPPPSLSSPLSSWLLPLSSSQESITIITTVKSLREKERLEHVGTQVLLKRGGQIKLKLVRRHQT